MSLSEGDRFSLNSAVKLESLPLSPEEAFVLSRIDGRPTVREIAQMSGIDPAAAEPILTRLVELGAIERVDALPQTRVKRPAPPKLGPGLMARERARERRRRVLAAQLVGADPNGETEENDESDHAPAVAVDPVAADDPRVDPSVDLEVDKQRVLLALFDGLDELTHYQVLGAHATDDPAEIRKAFHGASRRLHPDSYYGRKLGIYQTVLDRLFDEAKKSYAFLMDASKRTKYYKSVLAVEHERERLEHEQKQQVEAAESKKLASQAQEAADARRERDQARKRKQRKTFDPARKIAEQKQVKSKDHYEQGLVQMEAGKMGPAANFFRLALELEPNNNEYHLMWQQCIAVARRDRGQAAFERAEMCVQVGRFAEAAQYYVEAAEANPTFSFAAYAADAIRESDPMRAREFALTALDALNAAQGTSHCPSKRETARIHLMVGRAFLSAGQKRSAKEQAAIAKELTPEDPEVTALLKLIKVT